MERQRWCCQGQITKPTVSEMAICDFREVPVQADRVYSKTQCGNYLLKRPRANTGLLVLMVHPTVYATKVGSKFSFQCCQSLRGDGVLLMGKGVDILYILPGFFFSLSVFAFLHNWDVHCCCSTGHQDTHIYPIWISTHKFVFIKWKSWNNLIQKNTEVFSTVCKFGSLIRVINSIMNYIIILKTLLIKSQWGT